MKIFGIDPGSERTGYGCIETDGSRHRLVVCGRSAAPPARRSPTSCHVIHAGLRDAAAPASARLRRRREHLPRAQRAERAEARARARRRAAGRRPRRGVPIAEYTPAEIKRAVVGYGRAEKTQVQQMVKLLLGLDARAVAARRRRRAGRRDLPRPQRHGRHRGARSAEPARTDLRSWRAIVRDEPPAVLLRLPRHDRPSQWHARRQGAEPHRRRRRRRRLRRARAAVHVLSSWRSRIAASSCASTRTCAKMRSRCTASRRRLEHDLFERLISINGVGPKLALAVLSGIEPAELIRAVRAPGRGAADEDSRRRQEDRRADRTGAEGSTAGDPRGSQRDPRWKTNDGAIYCQRW